MAARGIDVPGVAAVVNFDFPNSVEMYVHRIGRTGRAGASGESFSLFSRDTDTWAASQLAQARGEEGGGPRGGPKNIKAVAGKWARRGV